MIENAKHLLKRYYGYDNFRDGQKNVIESILNGCDTFAIMPTGAGKSICYQIPALLLPGLTLVISPLISLMKDQVDTLKDIGIPSCFINSTLGISEVNERVNKARGGDYRLMYVAPERLESEMFKNLIKSLSISMIAVDEAHCVSQWGHDFRPSYKSIVPFVDALEKRPVIAAFTATATEEVKVDVVNLLKLQTPHVFITGFDRKNLFFSVLRGENKKDFIINYVSSNKASSGIIYAATRKEVDSIYEFLKKKGYSVGRYHAGMNDDDRKKSQELFLYDDIKIMVATNAFGMGIDKSNVRYVIHNNMPKSMEAYYQEAGRAGRDGEKSECILLFSPHDVLLQKFLLEQNNPSPERRANENKKLQDVVDYCHTRRCLRKYILQYFGEEEVPEECNNCSNCNDDSEESDITIEAQKIFSCILRVKERFGSSMIADILKGSKNKKVLELGFDNLSTYGIMKEYTVKEIKDIINLLIAEDYINFVGDEFPIIKLRQKGFQVIRGQEKVLQKIQKKKAKAITSDDSLFEVLRKLRKEISDREGVPPYIVFADTALREMSEFLPIDRTSMLQIKGVGENKLKRYGDEFINIIKNYKEEKL